MRGTNGAQARRGGGKRAIRALAVVAVLGMVAAACGGGKKNNASSGSSATTEATTDTTAAPTDSTLAPGETTTTAVGGTSATTGKSTATTAKKATTVTTRKSAATGATTPKNVASTPNAGIGNVGASTTAPNTAAQPGGEVTWLKAGEISGLDPAVLPNSGASDGPLAMAVMDLLVYSEAGTVKGQTAESLTSPDGLVWTMKLRPNIKFSDGTPYDAAAVKFNLDRLADPNTKAVRASLAQQIASNTVVDPLTLKMTLKAKNGAFPGILALIPFVGSPKAIQEKGDKFNSEPVGAGPYLLKSWTRDSQAVFERNPNYWNAPLPYIDRIIMKPIPDEGQRINTFCTGAAQISYVGSVLNADELTKRNCGKINPMILNGGTNLMMNTKIKPFNDLRLRQAISMAIDMNDYSKVVTNSLIAPTRSIFRTDSPFYDPNILQNAYNPTQAQALFDAVAKDNGGTISWTLTTFQTPSYATPADYLQAKFNAYKNVKVDLVKEASATHITKANTSDFTMSMFGNIFDDPEPTWTGIYTCSGTPNYTGYCDPKFDALVADNQQTLDPARRIQDVKDMQKLFYAATPTWFFENRYSWVFTVNNLQDFEYVNDGLPLLDRFWLKTR
jgi:peptide/nickel transport system substrate-binding protein